MRILWLSPGLLLPLDKGGKLRTWHLMRHLAAHHQITFLSFETPDTPSGIRHGMYEVCERLETIPRRDPAKGTIAFYVDVAKRLADPLPYAIAKYRSRAFRERIERLLVEHLFDLVVCDFLTPVVNLPPSLPCPAVLFTHNVEAEIWRRHSEQARSLWRSRLFETQWARMLRFEEDTLAQFDLVLAVSEYDRATFRRLYGARLKAPIHTVLTGVDTSYFAPQPATVVRPDHLVFTGSMDWIANEDAMRFFCREVLPLIRQVRPEVTLSIVGRDPTPAVRELAAERGVTVTGRVDDVRNHIAQAAAYIVPIRIGGGTRLKIFEAMAMGKAVVSTSIGAEGLPVADGANIVIADAPRAFADAVVALLREPIRRKRIEASARQLVVHRYDWKSVAADLETSLVQACGGQPLPADDSKAFRLKSLVAGTERVG